MNNKNGNINVAILKFANSGNQNDGNTQNSFFMPQYDMFLRILNWCYLNVKTRECRVYRLIPNLKKIYTLQFVIL